jgi:hypothetical protein
VNIPLAFMAGCLLVFLTLVADGLLVLLVEVEDGLLCLRFDADGLLFLKALGVLRARLLRLSVRVDAASLFFRIVFGNLLKSNATLFSCAIDDVSDALLGLASVVLSLPSRLLERLECRLLCLSNLSLDRCLERFESSSRDLLRFFSCFELWRLEERLLLWSLSEGERSVLLPSVLSTGVKYGVSWKCALILGVTYGLS